MTADQLDPALIAAAEAAHWKAWSLNVAGRHGIETPTEHNRFMTRAVLDAVADDIARAERERVLRLLSKGLSPTARKSLEYGARWVRLGSHEAQILLAAVKS